MTASILIVDDHPIVRKGIKSLLSNYDGYRVVGEASTIKEAVDQFRQTEPEVVLLDIRLAEESGLEALDAILDLDAQAKVLMLSSFDDEEYVQRSLQAGARGYVLKGDSDAVLVTAIEAVARGRRALSPQVTDQLVEQLYGPNKETGPEFDEVDLRMIALLAEGASNGKIAEELFMSDSTVKRRLRSIFARLEVSRRAEAVAEAMGRGLL
ncbi:MAG TPA: response regulator transcription factor [Acidimicrobiia bacterium]|nr:response regulator transcription factor [Acidimicrobiia bacterium]